MGTTTLGQSGSECNSNKSIVHISQGLSTGTSPSDGLAFYPGHSFVGEGGGPYLSAEMQLVYSTGPANWTDNLIKNLSFDL